MQTLSQIRELLAQRGLRPKHRLGQNFLHDKNQITKLIDAADFQSGDLVLEIGPGTGTLTAALLERGASVIACEIDEGMAGIIEDLFAEHMTDDGAVGGRRGRGGGGAHSGGGSLVLIRGDALAKQRQLNPEIVRALADRPFKLIANLPYQIASPLMTTLLIDHPNCTGQFVTIQKEVADRLMAQPRTKEYGPLTIIVQALADVQRIGIVSPSCFWPPPEVTSAMVAILPSPSGRWVGGAGAHSLSEPEARRGFARFITDLFTKRRKQLGTIFGRAKSDWPDGVTPDLRPEALSVERLVALWRVTHA